jgi:signal transduction histidine kinase
MSQLSLHSDALPPTSLDALHLLSRSRDMLGHEFRTCISMINGFASILEEVVHPEEHAHARSIQQASNRLYRTLEHLLDFIHIESDDQPIAPTLLKISRIARRTLENAERLNKNPDLEFVYQEQSANLWANIDLERFQHILMLLLENATHYATEGRIILTVHADEDFIRIRVSDTGLGIEAEFLPHISIRSPSRMYARKDAVWVWRSSSGWRKR